MDLQRVIAVGQPVHPHGVVEIAGGFAVDGDDVEFAKIAAAGDLFVRDAAGNGSRLIEHVIGKMMRDVMRADQDFDVDAEVVRMAQHLDDAAGRAVAVFAEIQNFGGDDHAFQILDGSDLDFARADAMRD